MIIMEFRLQRAKGKLNGSEEEIELKFVETPLWVRDRLVEILKHSSKGRSSCHGNAVVALACLVSVTSGYFKTVGESESKALKAVSERLSQEHWTSKVTETILCVLNPKHKTNEEVFSWLKSVCVSLLFHLYVVYCFRFLESEGQLF